MNIFDMISETYSCSESKKEKEEFINNLISFANELKEDLKEED